MPSTRTVPSTRLEVEHPGSDDPPWEWWRGKLAVGSMILLVYVALAVVAYAHAWAHPASVDIGAGQGDPSQTIWYLTWVPYALIHGHNPFFTTVANYPIGFNVLAQTSVLALGLVMAPVTLLFGPVVAWNVCATLAFALSAGSGYLLCRRFVTWRPAAFLGGLLYGFSPYMVGQGVSHLNLLFVPLPPLIFLALYELVVAQRGSPVRWGAFLACLTIVQFFVSTEILATTAMFAVLSLVVVVVVAAIGWRPALASHAVPALIGLGVAAVVAGAALAYPLRFLLVGPQHIKGSIAGYLDYYSVLSAPLVPTSLMLVGTAHLKRLGDEIGGGSLVENGTYLGVPLIAFFGLAAALVRRRVARVVAFLAVVAFVLSLGVSFHGGPGDIRIGATLPANWIHEIPLLDQAFPIRYSLYVVLFVAVVLAAGLDALRRWLALRTPRRLLGVTVPALVAVAALFPLIPSWPYPRQGPTEVPTYFTSSAVDKVPSGSVALVFPYGDANDTPAQLWQAESGLRFKMPGGYFLVPVDGHPARATTTFTSRVLAGVRQGQAPARTPALRQQLRAELGGWGVQSILSRPEGNDPVGFFTWLTGRPPSVHTGGIYAWYGLTWSEASS